MEGLRTVILVTRNGLGSVGEADRDFAAAMFDRFIHSLEAHAERPDVLCFYTEGVRLVCEGSKALLGLQLLAGLGVRLVVCQSCLEHYGLREKVAVGEVGSMKEIVDLLLSAAKVVTV
jgi:hypothetical protein